MAFKQLLVSKKILSNACQSHARKLSVTFQNRAEVSKSEVKSGWDQSVEDAIKCVGYQKPCAGLNVLSRIDEVYWANHMKKLEGTSHPMYNAAK
jgi:hypothetical protein